MPGAFSSKVGTGLRRENATKQRDSRVSMQSERGLVDAGNADAGTVDLVMAADADQHGGQRFGGG